jgi:5-methylcytosine-specific restriction endonuclease McrA
MEQQNLFAEFDTNAALRRLNRLYRWVRRAVGHGYHKSIVAELSVSDFKAKGLKALENGVCPYCGDALTIENISPDHIFPLHLGGSSGLHNIEFVCHDCNIEKAGMPMDEYLDTKPETRIGKRIQHDWSYRKRMRRIA